MIGTKGMKMTMMDDDDTNVMQDGDNIREVLKEYISSL